VHPDEPAAAEPREITALLRLRSEVPNRHDTREKVRADREDQAAVATSITQSVESYRGRKGIEPAPPVLLGNRKAAQPYLPALEPQLAREGLLAIPLGGSVVEDLSRKANDVVSKSRLVRSQREIH
jgi:hypothetical protein